jgi:hypothetical protein
MKFDEGVTQEAKLWSCEGRNSRSGVTSTARLVDRIAKNENSQERVPPSFVQTARPASYLTSLMTFEYPAAKDKMPLICLLSSVDLRPNLSMSSSNPLFEASRSALIHTYRANDHSGLLRPPGAYKYPTGLSIAIQPSLETEQFIHTSQGTGVLVLSEKLG